MKTIDIIEAFLNQDTPQAQTANMRIEGVNLYSYNTIIARFQDGELIVDTSYYSNTTSRQQKALLSAVNKRNGGRNKLNVRKVEREIQ